MDDLIREYDLLIRSIAKKFYNVEKEDLYQAGCLGLIKAYKNYKDPNVLFSSYAYKYIFGEMYDLSIKCRDIKLNKYYLKLYKLMNKSKIYLTQKLNREVTLQDISSYLEIDISELENVCILCEDMISLDDEYNNIQCGYITEYDNNILIKESLNTLDKLSSDVIKYRYLNDMTQSEVAKFLGITQVSVSRIESKSKKKILEYISN